MNQPIADYPAARSIPQPAHEASRRTRCAGHSCWGRIGIADQESMVRTNDNLGKASEECPVDELCANLEAPKKELEVRFGSHRTALVDVGRVRDRERAL